MSSSLTDHLFSLVYEIPAFTTFVVFFIIALVRWRYHPRVSRLAVLGLLILGITPVVQIAYNAVIWEYFVEGSGDSLQWVDFLETGLTLFSLFYVVGMALILTAVFISRSQPYQPRPYDDPDYPLPEELTKLNAFAPDDLPNSIKRT
jgi:hypothetical protein